MSKHSKNGYTLDGGEMDTFCALAKGPREDGDIPSKGGLYGLVQKGLAMTDYSYSQPNFLTTEGHLLGVDGWEEF